MRFWAIGVPIFPKPIQPTVGLSLITASPVARRSRENATTEGRHNSCGRSGNPIKISQQQSSERWRVLDRVVEDPDEEQHDRHVDHELEERVADNVARLQAENA